MQSDHSAYAFVAQNEPGNEVLAKDVCGVKSWIPVAQQRVDVVDGEREEASGRVDVGIADGFDAKTNVILNR